MTATRTVSESRPTIRIEQPATSRPRAASFCPDCHSPVTSYGCTPACRGLDTD
ncbi:MAG: hypothetical protein ACTHQ3_13010 [Motilibacteraceae bacterium]